MRCEPVIRHEMPQRTTLGLAIDERLFATLDFGEQASSEEPRLLPTGKFKLRPGQLVPVSIYPGNWGF